MTGIPDFTDPFVCLTRPAGSHGPISGGVVRAMKGATNIPGIRAYAEKGYASGGAR